MLITLNCAEIQGGLSSGQLAASSRQPKAIKKMYQRKWARGTGNLSELKKPSAVSINLMKLGVAYRRIALKPKVEFLRTRMSLLILGIKGSTPFPIYRDTSRSEGFWRSVNIHQKDSLCVLCVL